MKTTIEVLNKIENYVQECRAEGETDLRSIIHYIQAVKKDVQAQTGMCFGCGYDKSECQCREHPLRER